MRETITYSRSHWHITRDQQMITRLIIIILFRHFHPVECPLRENIIPVLLLMRSQPLFEQMVKVRVR